MSDVVLKLGAKGIDLTVDESLLLSEVEKAGSFYSTSVQHNKALRRLSERGQIDLTGHRDLHGLHVANAKRAAGPYSGPAASD